MQLPLTTALAITGSAMGMLLNLNIPQSTKPQTINGTVAAISNVIGQTSYQITLFNDDLIALFGSTQTVAAYSTAETHTITTSPLSVGSVARVRGLLFDDGGTLRMVATEIEDGVPGS